MKTITNALLLFFLFFPLLSGFSSATKTSIGFGSESFLLNQEGCSQGNHTIRGRVIDKATGETIPGATILIKGTHNGTVTDIDGTFSLSGVARGEYTLEVSFVSFEPAIIQNVSVGFGKDSLVEVFLFPHIEELQEVEITARSLRDREAVLVMEQMNATNFVSRIGGQEISRKGVGDVVSAITKMAGISVQESSNNLYIRGLGDRYNTTSINGLPIPSNNPELKNIALELFTTDIVELISVDKVYGSHLFGDYAGGNIDIVSKKPTGVHLFQVGTGSNVNSFSIRSGSVPLKKGTGFLGFHTVRAPGTLSDFAFDHGMDPGYATPIGMNLNLAAGSQVRIGGRKINLFASLKFDNDFSSTKGMARSVNSTGVPTKDLRRETHGYRTNTTGMLNIEIPLGAKSQLYLNSILVNSSNNKFENYQGTFIDIANNDNGLMLRKNYEKNTVIINQLLGQHSFGKGNMLNWGISLNHVSSDNPDRIQNTFVKNGGDYFVFGQNQITDNHRYFHYLKENEIALNGAMTFALSKNSGKPNTALTLGISSRYKFRNFNSTQYNFRIHTDQRNFHVDPFNVEEFFNQQNLGLGNFFMIETFRGSHQVPFALDPQVYTGHQFVQGGFASLEKRVSSKLSGTLGLRGEYIFQRVGWNTQLDPTDRSDVLQIPAILPSLSLRYQLTQKQNLRFGASKTYTLPQFKERALYIYEEVTQVKLGNPNLYQSDNYNVELKWELFPTSGELVSAGFFGKYIANPINEVTISSATNDISFLNTGDWGYVAGVELEVKKKFSISQNDQLLFGTNVSYMHTDQELNSGKIRRETIYRVNFTHDRARFTGASDWLLNADVSYIRVLNKGKGRLSTTATFRHVSDKIYALGTNTRGNIIDRPYNILDLIIQASFGKVSLGAKISNLLNPSIESFQQNLDREVRVLSFQKGIGFGFSLGVNL